MNPGHDSTPTPTNCLQLMQWNVNRISSKFTELLTFLHSNNVNIAAIHETKLKTPGWAAVRLDHQKNKGGGLLMLIKDTVRFVDNMAALPQSADPHLEQQGILITMTNRQLLHICNINIPPRSSYSAGHNASIAHLLCNNEMSLIVGDINAHQSRWDTNTNEDERGEELADEIDAADYTILNENEATRLPTNGRSTSPDISLATNDIALLLVRPAIICPASSPSTQNCPRLMGIGKPTSTSRKRTGHAMLKPATNTLLKLAKQELSNKPRRPSGKQ